MPTRTRSNDHPASNSKPGASDTNMSDHEEGLKLVDLQPTPSYVDLDTFWVRATDLQVLRDGFYWKLTSWLGPQLDARTRRKMANALDYTTTFKPCGVFHFGDTNDFSVLFVFPKMQKNLVKDKKLVARFHDEVLRPSYYKSRHYPTSTLIKPWEVLRLESQAARVEGMDDDAPDMPITQLVHPNTSDFGKWWQLIKQGVEDDPRLASLHGIFPAIVYSSNSVLPCSMTVEECWQETMQHSWRQIDAQFIVQDTMHTTFKTVSVAAHCGDGPGAYLPFSC